MRKREWLGRNWGAAAARTVVLAGLVFGPGSGARAIEPFRADTGDEQLETTATRLNYDREQGVVEAVGNVIMRRGDTELRADYVRVDVNTEEAQAFGDVVLTRGDRVWNGPRLDYNFKTGASSATDMTLESPPFYLRAERSERTPEGTYILHKAWVSTCNPDTEPVDFHVSARRLELVPDEYLKARGAIWWFGPVPAMYMPYWYRDLDDDFGFEFRPGYSSRWGGYLLSAYRYRINPGLTGRTHLDYRSERGVGTGQDFKWNTGGDRHVGELRAYYADDQEPLQDDDILAGKDITSDRYRIKYTDQFVLSPRDMVLLRGQYLSDIDMLEDFFKREHRQERQPDNYATYIHRGDQYSVSLLARSRLNDFYDSVNRLPEATLDVYQQQIGESAFYYESKTAAAYLERTFADGSSSADYDSGRFDTLHTIYRPDKHFGFLTLVPRVGARMTHYTATPGRPIFAPVEVAPVPTLLVDANGVTNTLFTPSGTVTNVQVGVEGGGGETRALIELGFETSYKAYGMYETLYGPRRHIVEPFANYTLVPEPNVTPDELYQFDEVDRLDEAHNVRLGVRNKWQEKRENGAYDLVNLELSTLMRFHKENEDLSTFQNLFWDLKMRPVDGVLFQSDGAWDLPESEMERYSLWLRMVGFETVKTSLEYRYRRDRSSLVSGDVTLFPKGRLQFNAFGRYEGEESRLEEIGGYVQKEFTCLVARLGTAFQPGFTRTDGTREDDEYEFRFEFWLTAFPQSIIGGTASN